MDAMKRYLMCSGGKDSMASVIVCHEQGIHIDGVVMTEIMFSHEKNISAEHPKHVEWLYGTAIPTIEKRFGYKMIVIRPEKDYIQEFNTRVGERAKKDRVGKKHGFVLGGNMCALKRDCKIKAAEDWCKKQGEFEKIVGMAFDESERLEYMHKEKNARSVLEEYKITEAMTYEIDRKYGLLSPFYDTGRKRQGCWFCPNCSLREFADLKKQHPDLWEELRVLSKDEETASKCFKYNKTFDEVDKKIDEMNAQYSFLDYLE